MVSGVEIALTCLALNVYKEARGEPVAGQMAVALVTVNRAKESNYSKDICTIVFEKGQFEWVAHDTINGVLLPDKRPDRTSKEWRDCEYVAKLVLNSQINDFTNGATFFHATSLKLEREKDLVLTGRWGAHSFFKPKKVQLKVDKR